MKKEQIEEIQNALEAVTPGHAPEWLRLLLESHQEQQSDIRDLEQAGKMYQRRSEKLELQIEQQQEEIERLEKEIERLVSLALRQWHKAVKSNKI